MKKILLIIIGVVVLASAYLYIFIPSNIVISKSITVQANQNPLFRKLADAGSWKEWWPGTQEATNNSPAYILNDIRFKPGVTKILSVPFSIDATDFTTSSELTLITLGIDSTTLLMEATVSLPNNPFTRLGVYNKSKTLANSISEILHSLNNIYSQTGNLYGYEIEKKSVVDSLLIFTSEEVIGYPTVEKIYSLIDQLKSYIQKNDAQETGNPMLNVKTADSINYLVKVAVPVNKKLPDSDKIHYKWMLGGGNILTTEVKGGPREINNAFIQLRSYVSDYNRISPAIPFESLVTDRRKEPDTSKWITRIYYPVM